MDLEKLIFVILAIGLSIFSMYAKSKKQKRAVIEHEESEPDFFHQEDLFAPSPQDEIFEGFDVSKLLQNSDISPKKQKKKSKKQNFEKNDAVPKSSPNISQSSDIMNDNELLEGFEGTEIQKAFLYSEIFKSTKN